MFPFNIIKALALKFLDELITTYLLNLHVCPFLGFLSLPRGKKWTPISPQIGKAKTGKS